MWLESHGNLARHPKTRRLMQRMGWTLPHTIGNLHLLWWWALDFAPTGDLTHFEPDQLTYDLDLGGATPEQFLEAMIHAGFIDRLGSGSAESRSGGTMLEAGFIDRESGTLRFHDWPDYTAKSLRPKFRCRPEKWHDVLRSYGRPIPPRRQRKLPSLPGLQLPPARAGEDLKLAVSPRRDADTVNHTDDSSSTAGVDEGEADFAVSSNDADKPLVPTISPAQAETFTRPTSHGDVGVIPKCLSGRRNFNDWWLKLQEQYQNKGCPLTAHEQREILAMLARNPFSAVEKLKYSVVNFEASFAALPALGVQRPINTS